MSVILKKGMNITHYVAIISSQAYKKHLLVSLLVCWD